MSPVPTAVVLLLSLAPAPAPVGPHVAVDSQGLTAPFEALLAQSHLDATGTQLLDYTFGSAPTDWEPTGGVWQVFSRFACDPSWSFYGGYSQGLAAVWNKRRFEGNQVVEAYVSFKHGLRFNPSNWSYRPADLCLTLCGDGADPASGYSFIYAGDEGSRTMIRRGGRVLAATSDPALLSPSYSDTRPSSEDFHRRWWRLEARLIGRTVSFLVDGKPACEAVDAEPLTSGRVALWTVRNGMMVARVRIAYQQQVRREQPLVTVTEPAPLPQAAPRVAGR